MILFNILHEGANSKLVSTQSQPKYYVQHVVNMGQVQDVPVDLSLGRYNTRKE